MMSVGLRSVRSGCLLVAAGQWVVAFVADLWTTLGRVWEGRGVATGDPSSRRKFLIILLHGVSVAAGASHPSCLAQS